MAKFKDEDEGDLGIKFPDAKPMFMKVLNIIMEHHQKNLEAVFKTKEPTDEQKYITMQKSLADTANLMADICVSLAMTISRPAPASEIKGFRRVIVKDILKYFEGMLLDMLKGIDSGDVDFTDDIILIETNEAGEEKPFDFKELFKAEGIL